MLRHWFRHGGVPVNLYAKRLCGASKRALAPPSSSNPQPRRNRSVEVRGEESPDRGDSSRPRTQKELRADRTRLRRVRCVGAPRPPPRPLAPPTAREWARGLGPVYSELPNATNGCAGHSQQTPRSAHCPAKLKQKCLSKTPSGSIAIFYPPAHSPGERPTCVGKPLGTRGRAHARNGARAGLSQTEPLRNPPGHAHLREHAREDVVARLD